uniref:Uncharacterized protein n=1 Tax=Anguilla anguilla TaxID=7936 RepID=A0A0E9P797_ANGAN
MYCYLYVFSGSTLIAIAKLELLNHFK